MIDPEHRCWWTSHRKSELTRRDNEVAGAGITLRALEHMADVLSVTITSAPSSWDQYAVEIALGEDVGTLHDECMPRFDTDRHDFIAALVDGMLGHHAAYLGSESVPRDVHEYICRNLRPDTTIHVTTVPRSRTIQVKSYSSNASWYQRWKAKAAVFKT